MKDRKILTLFYVLLAIALTTPAHAQELQHNNYQGKVTEVKNTADVQQATVVITQGAKKDQKVEVTYDTAFSKNNVEYKTGDKVMLLGITDPSSGSETFYITDFDRRTPLAWLLVIFIAIVLAVSKKWGLASLAGMLYSFLVIFKFILPLLLKGYNPLLIAIMGAFCITPVTFYLSHGFNRKTTVALMSTIIALSLTGLLAWLFIIAAKLTGFGSDEAFFLQILKGETVNIQGIFLAGIIIGTLGILDDITISQAAIVQQLKNSLPDIEDWKLYQKAMEIGHDHIASTVNTLILVYTGAALPLLLLFTNSSVAFGQAINYEIVADEIVRTLVASIGLVLSVPISTLLAVYFAEVDKGNHTH
jgi:uncharacterized membrane protein